MSGHLLYVQDAYKLIIAPLAFTNKQSTGSKICFERSLIMNPLSHHHIVRIHYNEVKDAIEIIDELKQALAQL